MLKEKEEVNRALAKAKDSIPKHIDYKNELIKITALAKAKDSIPKHIDYKNELIKITDALRMLKDENIDAKTKNQYSVSVYSDMVSPSMYSTLLSEQALNPTNAIIAINTNTIIFFIINSS